MGERPSEPAEMAVRAQLDRILKSAPFHTSQRRQRFLEFLVNETLAGRGDRLKAYTIALEVFERPASFDPLIDPLVRIEAGRLRDKLREYYEVEGQGDPVRIELSKGTYTPHIEFRRPAPTDSSSGAAPGELKVAAVGKPADVDRAHPEPGLRGWRLALPGMDWTQAATLAAALLIVAASILWTKGPDSGAALPEKPSIAVLPFDSFGADDRWERFAAGMTEDIITDLSHSRDLIVIARNSTEVYKAKPIDIRRIGRDLNVKYVLEGSIQAIGDRIRVTAQLVEANTGGHVWSERYDRPVDDLFTVQNDVTQRIAATLAGNEGAVADAERSLIRRKPPANLTAFDTYLLAMEAKHKVTKESLIEAEDLFRKSLELDPQLARAYVGLVDVQFYLIDLGFAPSVDEALSKMMTAAERAVALDPNDGKTHYALGLASLYNGKPQQAAAEFARAETLAPSDADMLISIGWSIPALGESERAVRLIERALTLNPHYPDWYNQGISYVYFFGERYDKSLRYRLQVKEPLALDYVFVAMANAYLGNTGEAAAATANVMRLDPSWNAERYLSEAGGSAAREAELFVDGARKAGLSACVPAEQVKDMRSLIRIKSCDQQRAGMPG
jgi:TolB-like protein